MDTKCAGIYALYNVMENKIYIGRSAYMHERFAAHRTGFRTKSRDLRVYSEPIENFAFVVLREMNDREYQKKGELYETVFIKQAVLSGIGVYNKAQVDDEVEYLEELLHHLDAKMTITVAIKKGCGYTPFVIERMGIDERERVRKEMNGWGGYNLENANRWRYNGENQRRGDYHAANTRAKESSEYQSRKKGTGENGCDHASASKSGWNEDSCGGFCCRGECFCVYSKGGMDADGK